MITPFTLLSHHREIIVEGLIVSMDMYILDHKGHVLVLVVPDPLDAVLPELDMSTWTHPHSPGNSMEHAITIWRCPISMETNEVVCLNLSDLGPRDVAKGVLGSVQAGSVDSPLDMKRTLPGSVHLDKADTLGSLSLFDDFGQDSKSLL